MIFSDGRVRNCPLLGKAVLPAVTPTVATGADIATVFRVKTATFVAAGHDGSMIEGSNDWVPSDGDGAEQHHQKPQQASPRSGFARARPHHQYRLAHLGDGFSRP